MIYFARIQIAKRKRIYQKKLSYSIICLHCMKKITAFDAVFDFIKNAKAVKIAYTDIGPEQFQLAMAVGNNSGIVGYDFPKKGNKRFLIPKTVQDKRISKVTSECNKLLYIMSKDSSCETYDKIEYEMKDGIIQELLCELPESVVVNIESEKVKKAA